MHKIIDPHPHTLNPPPPISLCPTHLTARGQTRPHNENISLDHLEVQLIEEKCKIYHRWERERAIFCCMQASLIIVSDLIKLSPNVFILRK